MRELYQGEAELGKKNPPGWHHTKRGRDREIYDEKAAEETAKRIAAEGTAKPKLNAPAEKR